jgi:hypothetical protein
MKKAHYFFALLFTALFFSNTKIIAFEPEGINLTKTSNGYLVEFVLPSYEMNSTFAEGEEYIQLTVPGFGMTPEIGLPALPLISFNLFIAYEEDQPEFSVKNITTEERILQNKIYPFQMPWEKSRPLSERPFTINKNYYNSTGKINQPAMTISEPLIITGIKGVIVTIYPFSYNPLENKLTVINSGSFEIMLDHSVNESAQTSKAFNQFFKNIFINYDGISSRENMKYLIITAPTLESGMQQFVTHKTGKGFDVAMFNTTITGNTTTAIKSFIQQRYNDPFTKPDFVLLVGDVADIPAWTGSGAGTPRTDLNYAQLEGGDYFADVFIGRFSVANTDELQNAIDKSLYMENYIGTLDKKNIFMSSTDNWQITEGTHNFIIDNYFGPAGYTNLKLYTYTYGATTQQLINALNDNQQFAIYSGHGSEYSWADGPPLNQQQVRDLTNTWYPYVYSFACVTGSYHLTECFGETWLRTDNGASTFYGSSVNSYWDEDDILEKKVFYAMFEDEIIRVTPMFDQGKIYFVNHYGGNITTGSTLLRYLEMYNLMGDPSMPVVQTYPPCPVEEASNPNPADDAINVPVSLTQLSWTNGAGAVTNETWFGTDAGSLSLVQGGTLASSWTLTTTLQYSTQYYWRVVEVGDTCSSYGTVWSFTTEADPNIVIDTLYCDAFENGIGAWTITNDGGTCVWENLFSPFPNSYTLPPTASGGLLAADADDCGSGTTLLSTATLNQTFDFTQYTEQIWIEFDNDWYILDAQDEAHVEFSTNGGSTWTGIWDKVGISIRNTHETIDLTTQLSGQTNVKFRLRSVQPGYDWWWVVDNFCVCGMYIVPVELASFTGYAINDGVELKWMTATETNNQGFEIERLNDSKIEKSEWEKVGFVAGFGTTTEPKAYSFTDKEVLSGTYTYRLKQIDFDGSFSYSEEVNVDVTSPIEYALEQNYPNPFNPSTTIKYSIPEDGLVKLSVFNLLGEEVTTLVNTVQKAGKYEVQFVASRFASGVYYYRMESRDYTSIKKMLLIK